MQTSSRFGLKGAKWRATNVPRKTRLCVLPLPVPPSRVPSLSSKARYGKKCNIPPCLGNDNHYGSVMASKTEEYVVAAGRSWSGKEGRGINTLTLLLYVLLLRLSFSWSPSYHKSAPSCSHPSTFLRTVLKSFLHPLQPTNHLPCPTLHTFAPSHLLSASHYLPYAYHLPLPSLPSRTITCFLPYHLLTAFSNTYHLHLNFPPSHWISSSHPPAFCFTSYHQHPFPSIMYHPLLPTLQSVTCVQPYHFPHAFPHPATIISHHTPPSSHQPRPTYHLPPTPPPTTCCWLRQAVSFFSRSPPTVCYVWSTVFLHALFPSKNSFHAFGWHCVMKQWRQK